MASDRAKTNSQAVNRYPGAFQLGGMAPTRQARTPSCALPPHTCARGRAHSWSGRAHAPPAWKSTHHVGTLDASHQFAVSCTTLRGTVVVQCRIAPSSIRRQYSLHCHSSKGQPMSTVSRLLRNCRLFVLSSVTRQPAQANPSPCRSCTDRGCGHAACAAGVLHRRRGQGPVSVRTNSSCRMPGSWPSSRGAITLPAR